MELYDLLCLLQVCVEVWVLLCLLEVCVESFVGPGVFAVGVC